MSNSSLVNYIKISPNSNNPRNNKIKKITIHHMAGDLSVEACGNVFASSSRQASSNYGIGSDGRVGMYVEEKNRAWSSSSPSNDNEAVTIEVANDGKAPDWHVSDKALAKLIDLCTDICKRNSIAKLNYTGDANGNLTRHNMFKNTTCPGPYLQSKFPYIADEVNKRLGKVENTKFKVGDKVIISGNLYKSSTSKNPSGKVLNKETVITRVVDALHPYNTTGDLGWMDESDIKLIDESNTYYEKVSSSYTSLVDALKSIGVDSSYSNRTKIAKKNGIKNYTGSYNQNLTLLNLLKKGKLVK